MRSPLAAVLLLATSACNCGDRIRALEDEDGGADGGLSDAGARDAGTRDAGTPDSGAPDSGMSDAGPSFELERAVRECERIESCMLGPSNFDGLTFLNACITWLGEPVPDDSQHVSDTKNRLRLYYVPPHDLNYLVWLDLPEVQRCVHAQTTCEGLFTCFNRGDAASNCDPQQPARCDGNVLISCQAPSYTYKATYGLDGGFRTFSYDCGIEQRTCASATNGSYGCTPSQCSSPPVCDGNTARRCYLGLTDVLPCPSGSACFIRSPPDALCQGSGGTCNLPAWQSHCDGARQVSCQFGAWATTDCAPGLGCHTAPNQVGFCGVAGECDPSEDHASCDASSGTVRVCALGRWMNVDCPSLGFSGCMDATLDHPALCR